MYFEERNFPVNFMCKGSEEDYNDFIEALSDGVLHTLNFAAISFSCQLRYVSCSNYKQGEKFSTFTITFAIDANVFENYVYSDPTMSIYGDQDNFFNFGHFRQFGITILDNYKNELLKSTNAKEGLKQSEIDSNGILYDDSDNVRFSQRKSRLSFIMQASSWSDLWTRWKALLYNLAIPGKKHILTISSMPTYLFTVWYDGMNVEQLMANSKRVVVKFNIDFYTEYDLSGSQIRILCTEDEEIVSTEDGYFIEV